LRLGKATAFEDFAPLRLLRLTKKEKRHLIRFRFRRVRVKERRGLTRLD
jgi:hypothetical protein